MQIHPKFRRYSCFGYLLVTLFGFFVIPAVWTAANGQEPTASEVVAVLSEDEEQAYADLKEAGESAEPYMNHHHLTDGTSGDVTVFNHFETDRTYHSQGSASAREFTTQEDALLRGVRDMASEYLNGMDKGNTFAGGRYRWLAEGLEYDLAFRDMSKEVTNRVSLIQKFEAPKIVKLMEVPDNRVVNIVLTLQGRLDKYATFLEHLAVEILPNDPNLTLTVVYFSDNKMDEAQEFTTRFLAAFPKFQWNFIPLEEENFSRGRGLHIGAQSLKFSETASSKIVFFTDVDVLMQPDFFWRCRSNVIEGRQVYYPIVFSLYNPNLVYPLSDRNIPNIPQQLEINDQSGFWRAFGYGMTCMYASDYQATGGFPDLKSWGVEDEVLYEYFLQSSEIKIVRSPDPSLFHLYHRKDCPDVSSSAYPACLKSKVLTEGSQLQLGLTLLKLREGTDLEGILSKRFYYFWLVPYLACFLFLSLVINILQATAAITSGRRIQVYGNVSEKMQ